MTTSVILVRPTLLLVGVWLFCSGLLFAQESPIVSTLPPSTAANGAIGVVGESANQHIGYKKSHKLYITYEYATVWPRGGPYTGHIYLPIPPDTAGQHITGFHSNINGSVRSDRAQRRLISVSLEHNPGDDQYMRWVVQISGQFHQRELVDGPPDPGAYLGPAPTSDDLRSTDSINWTNSDFRDWMDSAGLVRGGDESSLQFGHRAFNYIYSHGRYTYPPSTPWNAALGCHRLSTDCGGFSLVFAAVCRANRVPAHLLVGQWLRTEESGSEVEMTSRQPHVYTEFYDPQVGWIPVDLASAIMRVPGYAFGEDPGYFLIWHLDTDFHLATPQKSRELVQWIQNPSPWFSSAASYAAEASRHVWTVQGG